MYYKSLDPMSALKVSVLVVLDSGVAMHHIALQLCTCCTLLKILLEKEHIPMKGYSHTPTPGICQFYILAIINK